MEISRNDFLISLNDKKKVLQGRIIILYVNIFPPLQIKYFLFEFGYHIDTFDLHIYSGFYPDSIKVTCHFEIEKHQRSIPIFVIGKDIFLLRNFLKKIPFTKTTVSKFCLRPSLSIFTFINGIK